MNDTNHTNYLNRIDRPLRRTGAIHARHNTRRVRLLDGATVRLRSASDGDQDDEALRRLYFTLSDTTRYLYFCAGVPATALWAERFVSLGHADGERSCVLVAEVDGELIGFARFSQGPHPAPDDHSADMGIILT